MSVLYYVELFGGAVLLIFAALVWETCKPKYRAWRRARLVLRDKAAADAKVQLSNEREKRREKLMRAVEKVQTDMGALGFIFPPPGSANVDDDHEYKHAKIYGRDTHNNRLIVIVVFPGGGLNLEYASS